MLNFTHSHLNSVCVITPPSPCLCLNSALSLQVDGIYDSDPVKNPMAKKYNRLSYRQCTDDSLRVMDGEGRRDRGQSWKQGMRDRGAAVGEG